MDLFNPPGAHYYANLGLQQQATAQDIKTAFRKLAMLHHPDKLGPGQCDDAHEFRKAREAYECLIDPTRRAAYDEHYYDLQNEWTRYRLWQEAQNLGAEEKTAKYEEEKKAERAERARQKKRQHSAQAQEEEEDRQWRADMEKQRQAAKRSQQAGEVSPSEQHRLRREQKRQERERKEKKKKFDELFEATKAAWDRLVIERDAAKKRVKQLVDAQNARLDRIEMGKQRMKQNTESYKAAQLSLLKAKLDLRRLRTVLSQHTAELRQKRSDLSRLRDKLAIEIRNDNRISMSYHRVMKEHLRLEKAAQDQMMKQLFPTYGNR
ncbi:hypothetical protein F5X68DRAFT_228190 [Plectosphaerella plurivora]|uniref:J domain-containing protein n=1 Tax=Plectosphaerella plurivora TaxID=936078 RepID=A0A9P8VJC3_9PEZI|nr:hypothetical protein F5X68DRAFT_228190 [Plectosphaerella plurivora]